MEGDLKNHACEKSSPRYVANNDYKQSAQVLVTFEWTKQQRIKTIRLQSSPARKVFQNGQALDTATYSEKPCRIRFQF